MNTVRLMRSFRIRGRVQGVGFRWYVREAAVRSGITGWVRNEPDGSVSVEAEGSPEALDRFGQRLRDAPPPARVDEMIVSDAPVVGFSEFTIRY